MPLLEFILPICKFEKQKNPSMHFLQEERYSLKHTGMISNMGTHNLGRDLLALSCPMIKNLAAKRTSAERRRWKQWKRWQHNAPFLFEVLPEWLLIWTWGRGDVGCCVNLTQALSNTIAAYMWWRTRRQAWLLQAQLASHQIHRIQLLHFHNHFLITD